MTCERVDVLVVGGGPVGLFVATLLAARGRTVAVWERRTEAPSGSRAIGIHPPSLDAFATIGLDGPVLAEATRVRSGTARSRGRELGTLRFDRASATHPYVLTLDQHRTESLLRDRLAAEAPGALRVGTSLTALDRHPDHVVATGTDPAGGPVVLRAAFVVGADGARSVTRGLLGIGTSGRDYPDRYVMGDFADVEGAAARSTALVDVGPAGVVESFPLPRGRRRYVALLGPGEQEVDAAGLAALVARRTGVAPDPGTCTMTSGFRVRRRETRRVGVGRVVLVGDAAHEISPIGGQGMNLGWLDAAALAPLLAEATAPGGSGTAGGAGPWAEYARRRQAAARRAARQAELNMALGRPTGAVGTVAREALLRTLLSLPTADGLAGVYAMRWA